MAYWDDETDRYNRQRYYDEDFDNDYDYNRDRGYRRDNSRNQFSQPGYYNQGMNRQSGYDYDRNRGGRNQYSRNYNNQGMYGQGGNWDYESGRNNQGNRYGDWGYGNQWNRGSNRYSSYGNTGWQGRGYGSQPNYSRGTDYGYGQNYDYDYDYDYDFDTPTTFTYTEYWLIPGPFTGQGPEGYQRSDDRIMDDVCDRLTRHGQLDASDINVNVNNGEVTLTGNVDSRRAKRMAEDTAESVSGVKDVHNELKVQQQNRGQKSIGERIQEGVQNLTGQGSQEENMNRDRQNK